MGAIGVSQSRWTPGPALLRPGALAASLIPPEFLPLLPLPSPLALFPRSPQASGGSSPHQGWLRCPAFSAGGN